MFGIEGEADADSAIKGTSVRSSSQTTYAHECSSKLRTPTITDCKVHITILVCNEPHPQLPLLEKSCLKNISPRRPYNNLRRHNNCHIIIHHAQLLC
jgi:hypothetical protein